MAKLIVSGKELGFTIIPYAFDTPVQDELLSCPNDNVLGYISYNKETQQHRFTYTESGRLVEATEHWSLSIFKSFLYCEEEGPWIVYNCMPEKAARAFNKIISRSGESLHIYNWDTWLVEGKDAKVAIVNSWDIY
jgi:YD repeat-containing protein